MVVVILFSSCGTFATECVGRRSPGTSRISTLSRLVFLSCLTKNIRFMFAWWGGIVVRCASNFIILFVSVLSERERVRDGVGRRHVPVVRHSSGPGAGHVLPRQHHLRDHFRRIFQVWPVASCRLRRFQLQRLGLDEGRACRWEKYPCFPFLTSFFHLCLPLHFFPSGVLMFPLGLGLPGSDWAGKSICLLPNCSSSEEADWNTDHL